MHCEIRTWSFSMMAAVPMMGVFSQVNIEWSLCTETMVSSAPCWLCTTYVEGSKPGAVGIERVVVVV